jgi:hypothetical protein
LSSAISVKTHNTTQNLGVSTIHKTALYEMEISKIWQMSTLTLPQLTFFPFTIWK